MTISDTRTASLEELVKNSFKLAQLPSEYTRAMQVRSIALELALHYGLDKNQTSAAALLHNISRLIPQTEYLKFAQEYNIEIFPEEKENPFLLHQKISRVIAVEQFNITDKEVLNAISCHTTLRKSATLLDKIIFLATKQNDNKLKSLTFRNAHPSEAEKELNSIIYSYLFNLLNNKKLITTIHPWAQEALEDLQTK